MLCTSANCLSGETLYIIQEYNYNLNSELLGRSPNTKWEVIFRRRGHPKQCILFDALGPVPHAVPVSQVIISSIALTSEIVIIRGYPPEYIISNVYGTICRRIYFEPIDNRPINILAMRALTTLRIDGVNSWITRAVEKISQGARVLYLLTTDSPREHFRSFALLIHAMTINKSNFITLRPDCIDVSFRPHMHKAALIFVERALQPAQVDAINGMRGKKYHSSKLSKGEHYLFTWDGIILIYGRIKISGRLALEVDAEINIEKCKTPAAIIKSALIKVHSQSRCVDHGNGIAMDSYM